MNKYLTITAALLLVSASAVAANLLNTPRASDVAVGGFDTVAFFTESRAVNGSPFIRSEHEGATYLFASEENKALFDHAPEKYVPQFGGYCAYGVSLGALFPVDVSTWQVRDGKLYLNLSPEMRELFDEDFEGNVSKARGHWPNLVKEHTG